MGFFFFGSIVVSRWEFEFRILFNWLLYSLQTLHRLKQVEDLSKCMDLESQKEVAYLSIIFELGLMKELYV